jgi:glycosyltransferase involved in cell wall biosynthesis
MKILYFSRSYTPHDYRFLSTIVEGGHQAYLLRLDYSKSSETRPLPKGVRSMKGRLERVIAQVQPDLLHAGPLADCGYLAARSGFHPLVQMSWGSDLLWEAKRNASARNRVALALAHADVFIGDCKAVKQAAIRFGVPPNRIITFPWGVDLSKFKPTGGDQGLRARLGWQKNFVVLHLRSWESLYDPITVIRAFIRAARQNADLRLLMPGTGSLKSEIPHMVKKSGLQEKVFFVGSINQSELPAYYRAADVYVSASLSDGSSVSLMEALASGLPSIVTNIPSNQEWVSPGRQGWLFPEKDEVALSEAILKVVKSIRLKQMAKYSRKQAEFRANWNLNKQQLFRAYDLAMKVTR